MGPEKNQGKRQTWVRGSKVCLPDELLAILLSSVGGADGVVRDLIDCRSSSVFITEGRVAARLSANVSSVSSWVDITQNYTNSVTVVSIDVTLDSTPEALI